MHMAETFDVLIIGGGPAGLTAGIYTARADLKTLMVSGSKWGGQLMLTTTVENFPGFPEGIEGPELMTRMRKQAEKFGVKIEERDVTEVETGKRPFMIRTDKAEYLTRSVIVATGAETVWLGVPGEEKLIGRGVSSCAPCDAAFFKGRKVAVVGGGDAAMEEALVLTKFASEVTIIHRRESFRASKVMQERVLHNPKIKVIWNSQVTEILGESKVEGVRLAPSNTSLSDSLPKTGEVFPVDGVFVAIGHSPMTKIFQGKLELDEKGYIKRKIQDSESNVQFKMMTSVPGVFVAGDVHDWHYKQAITAAGFGCQAALESEKWLEEDR
jgi:thioredoxin reductase (NADPH)